jgi:YceI-like domain
MALSAGSYRFGPDNATLRIRTKKGGAASMAGHNLLIEVTAWSAALDVGDDVRVQLSADSRSLNVLEGTGGVSALDDHDKANINQTINDEVLKGSAIEFRGASAGPAAGSDVLAVQGELELAGRRHPIAFELTADDGRVAAAAVVKQSDWGMKPYTALFGTLKVLDEVTVELNAELAPDKED